MVHGHRHVEVSRCVSTPKITATSVSGISAPIVLTPQAPFAVAISFDPRGSRERTIL